MAMIAMTQQEYIDRWKENAMQHFDDGDYEWICNQIESYSFVLEVGCGSGESTLVLVLRGHRVLSIDINPDAINSTKNLINNNDYAAEIITDSFISDDNDAWLWSVDIVNSYKDIITVVKQLPIDLILLCNPGGNLDPYIRLNEVELLLKYGFTHNEIDQRYRQGAFHLLHKYSMIDAASEIAIQCGLPLMVVDRGDKAQVEDILNQIIVDTKMTRIADEYRKIRKPPTGGITLGDVDGNLSEQLYWGAGLFMPQICCHKQ